MDQQRGLQRGQCLDIPRRADGPGRHGGLGHADQPQLDRAQRHGHRLQHLPRHDRRRRKLLHAAQRRHAGLRAPRTTTHRPCAGTTCYYTVEAVDASGGSVASGEANALTYPAAPTGLAPRRSRPRRSTSVGPRLAARSPATTSTAARSPAEKTTPRRSTAARWSPAPHTTTRRPSAGTTYYYTVEAVDASGSSVASSGANALTFPAVPTGLARQRSRPRRSTSVGPRPSGTVTGYDVYRGTTIGEESATPLTALCSRAPHTTTRRPSPVRRITIPSRRSTPRAAVRPPARPTPSRIRPPRRAWARRRSRPRRSISVGPRPAARSPATTSIAARPSASESATPLNSAPLTAHHVQRHDGQPPARRITTPSRRSMPRAAVRPPARPTPSLIRQPRRAWPRRRSPPRRSTSVGLRPAARSPATMSIAARPQAAKYSTPLNGHLCHRRPPTATRRPAGTTYYYTVEAVNASGSSAASGEATP